MNSFSLSIYKLLFPVISGAAGCLKFLHPRLRTFFSVRENMFEDLENKVSKLSDSSFRLWVHAASVGEFEQARPIIAALKEKHPDIILFVSFLSDSGYNARKNFPDAAAVFYLPPDTAHNAKRVLSLLQPDIMLLMRYDFWPNHLLAAKKSGARLLLAAAVLQQHAPYFNPLLKSFYRTIFSLFDTIFTASEKDTTAFRSAFECRSVKTAGDPRFDQVVLRSRNHARVDHLKPLFENLIVLVAGSVWNKDETMLLDAWQKLENRPSLILVPHQVTPENLAHLEADLLKRSLSSVRVSLLNASFNPRQQILIIDQTGYLAELYSIASMAYVGGGFGVNVHNTLEPAVFAIPVLFGPRHHNSPEAEDLAASGGGTVIHNESELAATLKSFTDNRAIRVAAGEIAGKFVKERAGATAIVAASIEREYSAHKRA
ncbi:MAG: 3-deoxy-D-manno-octulosonic acid transferase [Chlorobiaceae bacterium]|nr:3-deoxy-D-manno-octulosonic acid transferase [Chlorobiaceae bacterium]